MNINEAQLKMFKSTETRLEKEIKVLKNKTLQKVGNILNIQRDLVAKKKELKFVKSILKMVKKKPTHKAPASLDNNCDSHN